MSTQMIKEKQAIRCLMGCHDYSQPDKSGVVECLWCGEHQQMLRVIADPPKDRSE